MTTPSLKSRYLAKLTGNSIGALAAGIVQFILPRYLGPAVYGNYQYLASFFQNIINLFDAGSSTCYYVKLSRDQKNNRLIAFYCTYLLLEFFCIAILTTVLWFAPSEGQLIDQFPAALIALVGLWSFSTWLLNVIQATADAHGLTTSNEKRIMVQKLCLLIAVLLFAWFDTLHLELYLITAMIMQGILYILSIVSFGKHGLWTSFLAGIQNIPWKTYCTEFFKYIHPLIAITLASSVIQFFDRWLLQMYGGSVEQGYYSLAFQFGALCILFTSSIHPLLTRELSLTRDEQDKQREMIEKMLPVFFAISSFLCCFLTINAKDFIAVIVGPEYKGAVLALQIMSFYPIHQTLGQISGSFFFAQEYTKLYRNIIVATQIGGLLLSVLIILPPDAIGLGTHAEAIALKMVLLQLLTTNVLLIFIARKLNSPFSRLLRMQVVILGLTLSLSFTARWSMDLANWSLPVFILIGITFLIYLLFNGLLFIFFPGIIGPLGKEWRDHLISSSK